MLDLDSVLKGNGGCDWQPTAAPATPLRPRARPLRLAAAEACDTRTAGGQGVLVWCGALWGRVGGGGTRPHIVGDLEGVTSSRRRIGAAAWD